MGKEASNARRSSPGYLGKAVMRDDIATKKWGTCRECGRGLGSMNVTGICVFCRTSQPPKPRGKKCKDGCSCARHNGALRGIERVDNPHIITQHDRVRTHRGRADEFYCYGCSDRIARDWANIHSTDRRNVDNYIPLCRGCHIVYDRIHGYDDDTLLEMLKVPHWRAKAISKVMRDMKNGGGAR
jgi:hypothetical protein